MKRRNFLKIMGTGSVVLAAGIPTGCSFTDTETSPPDQPWHKAGSRYQEARMRALSYAILAPNPHNRQPWLVRLDDQMGVTLYCQLDRRLPETDPFDRQILIGLGCFSELLRMAAAEDGYDVNIRWFPEGKPEERLDTRPIAHIQFVKGGTKDPLFRQVLKRRSNKDPFDTKRTVDDQTLGKLQSSDTNLHTSNEMRLVEKMRKLTLEAFMLEIETPRTYMESVHLMRIGDQEIAQKPDGIDLGGFFFSTMNRLGLVTREKLADPESMAYKQGIPVFSEVMQSAMAYVWITSPGNTREDQLSTGARYIRTNLKATELGLDLHPVSQSLQEYPEMDTIFQKVHKALNVKMPARIQMLARLGYGDKIPFSPRWPLETRIKS